MASEAVIDLVRDYLELLNREGFHVYRAVLFGSQARGEPRADSDIDILITSPDFEQLTWTQEEKLWALTARLDTRLEPIACGESRWRNDDVSPLIEAARREGIVINIDPHALPYPAQLEWRTLAQAAEISI